MVSDLILLVLSLGGLATTVLFVLFVAGFFSTNKKVANQKQAEVLRGGERGGLAALRKLKDRKRRNLQQEEADARVPDQNEAVEAARDDEVPVEP